jgi:VIT1/CCC1 family predicted Fe2+/Mn2+ transporter
MTNRPTTPEHDTLEHGHSQREVEDRIAAPGGRGDLRDMVYGAIDGAVTTFAIVAGVAGAGLSPFVILALGFANILADGFSMAAGNYSATKAERDDARRLAEVERRHLDDAPGWGKRREIREILRRKGLSGDVLEGATEQIAGNREAAVQLMLVDEYGLSPVEPDPMRAAIATFLAFLVAGFIPLLPFIFGIANAFTISATMTCVVFFAIGAAKSIWSLSPWWRSGLETLFIGGGGGRCGVFRGLAFCWLRGVFTLGPPAPIPCPHDASLRHRHSNYLPGALNEDAGTKVLELSHRTDIPLMKMTS